MAILWPRCKKKTGGRTPPFCTFHSRDGATVAKWATALMTALLAVVNSMHDPTPTGLLSSRIGFRLSNNNINRIAAWKISCKPSAASSAVTSRRWAGMPSGPVALWVWNFGSSLAGPTVEKSTGSDVLTLVFLFLTPIAHTQGSLLPWV